MEIHFIDVGCGNMTLVIMPHGTVICCDCNITEENQERVLKYLKTVIGAGKPITVFITTHREGDHIRGIQLVHAQHAIKEIWDAGVPGPLTESPEYLAYMELRGRVTAREIGPRKFWEYGDARLRCLNAKWNNYSEPNDQSLVLKIQYKDSSAMLAGDSSFRPWKEKILTYYSEDDLKSSILLASHHGSGKFFDDPADEERFYTAHIKKIKPEMTLISVGQNGQELPDPRAIELYEEYSTGSNKGKKIYTTQDKGTMKLGLHDDGTWSLATNQ